MKFIKLLLFTMILLQSPITKADEPVPPTVPEWLTCKLDQSASFSYTPYETLFISFPNKQVWLVGNDFFELKTGIIGTFGSGLTIHRVEYSTKNHMENSTLATHSLNGRIGDSFIRYVTDITFKKLEVSEVNIENGMIRNTPDLTCYTCQPTYVKPKLVEEYEKKHLKEGYLEEYLKK